MMKFGEVRDCTVMNITNDGNLVSIDGIYYARVESGVDTGCDLDVLDPADEAAPPANKPGDVVRLKSGGQQMTVLEVRRGDEAVAVVWMAADGTLRREALNPVLLYQPTRLALG